MLFYPVQVLLKGFAILFKILSAHCVRGSYPNSDRSMAHIRFACLRHWVVVDVDDLVEILGDNLRYLFQSVEIEDFFLCIDKLIDSNGG